MGKRKLKIADVARETGLNRNTVSFLYNETASRVGLDAIGKLCELFDCEVGQSCWRIVSYFQVRAQTNNASNRGRKCSKFDCNDLDYFTEPGSRN